MRCMIAGFFGGAVRSTRPCRAGLLFPAVLGHHRATDPARESGPVHGMTATAARMRRALNTTKIRFLVIGAWNTAFGYGVFSLLYELFSRLFTVRYLAYTSAQVVGWVIAVANAYLLHRHVTFRSATKGRAAVLELLRFMQTYVAMFFFGLLLLPFLVEIVGFGPRVAALVATAIGAVLSYVGHRYITFRSDRSPQS